MCVRKTITQSCIFYKVAECSSECRSVFRRDQEPVLIVGDDIWDTPNACGDPWKTRLPRFNDDVWKRFRLRWKDEHIECWQKARSIFNGTGEEDMFFHAKIAHLGFELLT